MLVIDDDMLLKISEFLIEEESIKYLESVEEEIKNIELPEDLDKKLWEITEKYMK